MTLGKPYKLTVPQFPHPQDKLNNSVYFFGPGATPHPEIIQESGAGPQRALQGRAVRVIIAFSDFLRKIFFVLFLVARPAL